MSARTVFVLGGLTAVIGFGPVPPALAAAAALPATPTVSMSETPLPAPDGMPTAIPGTTTDCGLPSNDQPVGEPTPDSGTVGIGAPEPATPGLDPGVICIASGVAPGGGPRPTGSAVPLSAPGAGAVPQLPRTGPAPLLPLTGVGLGLLLVGLVLTRAASARG